MGKNIEYSTSVLAREKGYNVDCDWRYDEQVDPPELLSWKDYRVQELLDSVKQNSEYAYRYVDSLKDNYFDTFDNDDEGFYVSAPTQTDLQTWLRDTHGIHVYVTHKQFAVDGEDGYYYHFGKSGSTRYYGKFKSYEEALEDGLIEGLKFI